MSVDRIPIVTVSLKESKSSLEIPHVKLEVDHRGKRLVFSFSDEAFEAVKNQAGDLLEKEGAYWDITVR